MEKNWREENKDTLRNKKRAWYYANRDERIQKTKDWQNANKKSLDIYRKNYNKTHRNEKSKYFKNWYSNNKDYELQRVSNYYNKNKNEILEKIKETRSQLSYDPKQRNICTLSALYNRKHRNKELYKYIIPSQWVLHFIPCIQQIPLMLIKSLPMKVDKTS